MPAETPNTDKPLKPREEEFVARYADPRSESYSDAKASAKASGFGNTPGSQEHAGWRLTKNPRVRNRIAQVIDTMHASPEARAAVLRDVLRGETREERVIEVRDADGELAQTRTESKTTSVKDRLQAIHILNRMDGTYSQADAVVDVQRKALEAELRELSAELGEPPPRG